MSKLPIIVNICDTNRHSYGNKTFDLLFEDPRFQVKKWNCLSESGDNCGVRCRIYCEVSPYVVVGDKTNGEEIKGSTHKELLDNLLEFIK
jgi:uncharacterized protein YuzB (UPF0349 family)